MYSVANDQIREPVTVRLSHGDVQQLRLIANEEAEGNVSQMIRKLIAEALQARGQRDGIR